MCGRFTLVADADAVADEFGIDEIQYNYDPRYNVAPAQTIAVVTQQDGQRVLSGFRWGLVPRWAKDVKIGYKMINARAETLDEKPSYRGLLAGNRILIPADGFYEWKQEEDGKQPYRFQLRDKSIYGYAGLYDVWKSPEGEWMHSCTIITTQPNGLVKQVHDRMPVILKRETAEAWLDPANREVPELLELLKPYPAEEMLSYPVSRAIGNVKNIDPSLIAEVPLNSK
ncbi:SOS response-associated peptidase [Paenibacillus pinistramenti]|uniref:SOS response-associated peptidase n=1 Tax=Paenibacillus pinistramenti TaxID=1768003 RepID=UPI00110811CE|nr:SOS response-associated peptidase [Paenibacillus pinistramenti]